MTRKEELLIEEMKQAHEEGKIRCVYAPKTGGIFEMKQIWVLEDKNIYFYFNMGNIQLEEISSDKKLDITYKWTHEKAGLVCFEGEEYMEIYPIVMELLENRCEEE